jgi:hypothetical protein
MKVNELFSQLQLPVKSHMPSFEGANAWLNTEPLTADALRGKVVAVDFWTFTCINWLRTLPYIRAWANTYTDKGVNVVTARGGVEHDFDNVGAVRMASTGGHRQRAWSETFANRVLARLHRRRRGAPGAHEFGEGGCDKSERGSSRALPTPACRPSEAIRWK